MVPSVSGAGLQHRQPVGPHEGLLGLHWPAGTLRRRWPLGLRAAHGGQVEGGAVKKEQGQGVVGFLNPSGQRLDGLQRRPMDRM